MTASEKINAKARALGFTHVGIAGATRLDAEAERLNEWLARGYHGTMGWMARDPGRRVNPTVLLPGALSVIAVAMNYYTPHRHADDAATGKISRYAWGDDYHEILTSRLQELWSWLQREFPGVRGRSSVDSGPVMDKVWAERAGIGWIGKHTNVITPDRGSWVFLGELITTLELEPDPPATDHCGSCTLCLEACPTGAIVQPYVVDSNLCLSYLTIEYRGEIPDGLKPELDGWIFGCDICQDVCPWNRKFAVETAESGFQPREGNLNPVLSELEAMTKEQFSERFRSSPILRTKHAGLVRNVKAVLESAGSVR